MQHQNIIRVESMIDKVVFSVPELAHQLGVSRWTVYRLVWGGKLPTIQVGRQIRFQVKAIEKWILDNAKMAKEK